MLISVGDVIAEVSEIRNAEKQSFISYFVCDLLSVHMSAHISATLQVLLFGFKLCQYSLMLTYFKFSA